MKRHVGCPKKQKNNQKETFPSSLSYSISIFDSFFSIRITGACIIIARKA